MVKSTSNAFIGLEAVDLDQDADLDFISVEFSTVSSPGSLFYGRMMAMQGFTKSAQHQQCGCPTNSVTGL
ncbi:MAG: hypothetical protein IPP49_02850 [Saprospiraceae bacterium]|nr:hypothetical protein [Saprospiraceae bacterium]